MTQSPESEHEAAKQLYSWKWLFLAGSLIYPAFGLIFRVLHPEALDPMWERLTLGLIFMAAYVAVSSEKLSERVFSAVFNFCTWIYTGHSFWLAHQNPVEPAYLLGALLGVSVIISSLRSPRALTAYSAFVLSIVSLQFLYQRTAWHAYVLFSAVAMIVVFYFHWKSRVKIARALQENEMKMRLLLGAIPDALLHLDRSGKILEFLAPGDGALPAEWIGTTPEESLPPNVASLCSKCIELAFETGKPQNFEFTVPAPTGLAQMEARISPYSSDRAIAVVRNITELKQMESRVSQADRMASLGTLVAGVAHEINNPLAYIHANLEIIRQKLDTKPDAELDRLIEDACHGAWKVKQIVADLKAYSRTDEKIVGPVDLSRVIESATKMATNQIRHLGRLETSLGAAPCVTANEGKLTQVFLNMLMNAAHALDESKSAANVIQVILGTAEDGRAEVRIVDNGCGMTPDVLSKIFDPFFTTKPAGVGTGLGLWICHSIVTGFRGEIQVNSSPGLGSSFRVLLPSNDAVLEVSELREHSEAHAGQPKRTGKVLIIDDEAILAHALGKILSSEHQVRVATSGKEGMERIQKDGPFDIVLCDLMMPDMPGNQVFDSVVRVDPQMRERFLFMTGGAFTSATREFLRTSKVRCIEKPFEAKQMLSVVRDKMISNG